MRKKERLIKMFSSSLCSARNPIYIRITHPTSSILHYHYPTFPSSFCDRDESKHYNSYTLGIRVLAKIYDPSLLLLLLRNRKVVAFRVPSSFRCPSVALFLPPFLSFLHRHRHYIRTYVHTMYICMYMYASMYVCMYACMYACRDT